MRREGGMTGIILAGGRSRRMGQPKALMPWQDGALIDAVIARLQPLVDEVLIVAKDSAPFLGRDARVVTDVMPETHPLVGICTGLLRAQHEVSFVCACDMPHLQPEVIRYLNSLLDGFDAVVPETPHGLEPLHAIYTRRCLPALEQGWDAGDRSLQGLLDALTCRIVPSQELQGIEGWERSFINVNAPEDYQLAAPAE